MITPGKPRHFAWDALVAIAFFLLAIYLGKAATRIFTPVGGVFVAILCGAIGYAHARSAWRGLQGGRNGNRPER